MEGSPPSLSGTLYHIIMLFLRTSLSCSYFGISVTFLVLEFPRQKSLLFYLRLLLKLFQHSFLLRLSFFSTCPRSISAKRQQSTITSCSCLSTNSLIFTHRSLLFLAFAPGCIIIYCCLHGINFIT